MLIGLVIMSITSLALLLLGIGTFVFPQILYLTRTPMWWEGYAFLALFIVYTTLVLLIFNLGKGEQK